MPKELREKLQSIIVSHFDKPVINGGKVITLQHSTHMKEAVKTLTDNRIYSAPVWNEEVKQFIGVIDMIDVVEFISNNFDQASKFLGDGFEAIFEQATRFLSSTVGDIVGISQRDPLVPVPDNGNMFDVVRLLSDKQVHRVLVFNDKGALENIITQSAVLHQFRNHLEYLGELGLKTMDELNLGTTTVLSIKISASTIDAFRLLRTHKLYAVPVVNEDNKLVGNISAKDIYSTCSSPAHLYLLYASLSVFFEQQDHQEAMNDSITCSGNAKLIEVIGKLVDNKVHRVYLVDDNQSIQKIITLTDILKLFSDSN